MPTAHCPSWLIASIWQAAVSVKPASKRFFFKSAPCVKDSVSCLFLHSQTIITTKMSAKSFCRAVVPHVKPKTRLTPWPPPLSGCHQVEVPCIREQGEQHHGNL